MSLRKLEQVVIKSSETSYLGGDVQIDGMNGDYTHLFGGGYLKFNPDLMSVPKFYYYAKDHLGNIRSVATKTNGVVEEVQHTAYYPFGGIIADLSTGRDVQNRLYNGQGSCKRMQRCSHHLLSAAEAQPKVKEQDFANNLFWLDYGARQYDPTRGQFTNYDQHCESYYNTNPLTYCGNNPIIRIDPTGMDWYKKIDENNAVSYIWQEGSDDIEGYENIGAIPSKTFGNVTYNFEQNELVSMTETVLSPEDWSSQMANSSEKMQCHSGIVFTKQEKWLKKSGATSFDSTSYNISGNDNMQSYIDSQIDRGASTRVHVDRKTKKGGFDGVGDHWVAISSRTTNFRNNEVSYNFYDPGTYYPTKGTSSDKRFCYRNNVWTSPAPNYNKYNMVHVRKNRL